MASKYSQIDDVCPGRIDWKIKARVLNLWTIPNFRSRIGDGTWPHSSNNKKDLLATYRQQISEGEVYSFQIFFFSEPTNKLKATRNQYKLFFLRNTIVEKISDEGISKFAFNFVSFDSILNKENESFRFDVIGHVVENEKIRKIVKPDKTMKLLTFVLEDLEKKMINCTLWDAFAEKLNEAILDATTLKKSIIDTDREDSDMTPKTDKSNKRKRAMYISSDDGDDTGGKPSKVRPRLVKVKVEKED
ncbi:uncharacterized protein [Rutidosis leptorrhynchoides]|uniref:uncharacterized protein n=1 Tax=Rutidosis leptorrhynchoides TaxID=125765 RepID=UPI003A9A0E84